jgi:spore coat protein U-like protein
MAAGAGLLAATALGLLAGPADAATATNNLAITATVQATCTQVVTPLAFGIYTGLVLPGTATITVTCTNTTPYNIGLGAGAGTGATVTTRSMTAAGASLNYVLTSDAPHAVNWGNTIATDTIPLVATLTPIATTIYGQVAAGQFVAPGAYTDTVVATVTY